MRLVHFSAPAVWVAGLAVVTAAPHRSGEWEEIDFLARGTVGFAVTEITAGTMGEPLVGMMIETRPLGGAGLGETVRLGNIHNWQVRAGAPADHLITAVGFRRAADSPLSLAMETAPLPEGVTLGEPIRSGTPGEPDVFLRVPEGHYITGIGGSDGQGRFRQIGITVRHLAPDLHEPPPAPEGYLTIYLSPENGDDANSGADPTSPVRTLNRAKETALSHPEAAGFRILLRGGETLTPAIPMRNEAMDNRNEARGRYALMWDLPQGLILSTYGSGHMAVFGPGGYTRDPDAVQGAICVVRPNRHPILIENIHFHRWQMEVLYTLGYLPQGDEKLVFRNNLVQLQGTFYFPGETSREGRLPFYTGGTLQPRSSRNLLIENNIFRDIHNGLIDGTDPVLLDKLHVFYFGRTGDSVVRRNVVQNTSGSPFKVRARDASNIDLVDNAFYYATPSKQLGLTQEGWLRVSTTAGGDDWPENLKIRDNYFYHPFCWPGLEDCATAEGRKYSIARSVDWNGAVWENNRFILTWE